MILKVKKNKYVIGYLTKEAWLQEPIASKNINPHSLFWLQRLHWLQVNVHEVNVS